MIRSPKILEKLARARDAMPAIPRTQRAVERVPDQRGRTTTVEWYHAPGHEVHEASQAALAGAGLMLVIDSFVPDQIAGQLVLRVRFAVVDRDTWLAEDSEAALPIASSSLGTTAAAAGTLGMVTRHIRLLLLDVYTPPADEVDAALETLGRRHRGRASMVPDGKALDLGPSRGVDVGEDAMPAWGEPEAAPEPEAPVTVEEAKANAVDAVIRLGDARRSAGLEVATTSEVVAAAGLHLSPSLTAADWRRVQEHAERTIEEVRRG